MPRPAGGADLMLAEEAFGHLVERAMVRRDHVRGFAHQQSGAVHATAFKTVDLLEQHFGIDDDAVADHGGHVRADDAGGQQVQRIRFVADHHGMARVVAAVETGDVVDLRADQISCLAFALVSPLGTDQNNSRHVVAPPCVRDSALSLALKPYKGYSSPSTGSGGRPRDQGRPESARRSGFLSDYFSACPALPSCLHASTTRAAIADSASRPQERGSYSFLLPTSPSILSTES